MHDGGQGASGSRPYVFAVSQLYVECWLTDPLYTGVVFSVWIQRFRKNTVTFSCTLIAVKDRLCF